MKKDQRGFSAVALILILLIVGLIGFVGWYVWNSKNSTTPSQSTSTSNTTSQDTQKYKVVTEWDIKVPVSTEVGAITYTIGTKVGYFRSTELDKISNGCDNNTIIIARGKATEVVPNEAGSLDGDTFETTYNALKSKGGELTTRSIAKKIGDYYYVPPGYSNASCISDNTSYDLAAETTAELNIIKALDQMVAE